MKAYTVYQPYAYATVAGLKHYETRPRRTSIRGRVAVHAGKKRISLEDMTVVVIPAAGNALHYGAVIGTVEIVDCVPVEEIRDKLTEREKALGDYSPGRFAWVLRNPEMFDTPIPARGAQGWWNWTGERCRECWCMTCDAFRTAACLEGKDVCSKCSPENHTSYCPWHPDENKARL